MRGEEEAMSEAREGCSVDELKALILSLSITTTTTTSWLSLHLPHTRHYPRASGRNSSGRLHPVTKAANYIKLLLSALLSLSLSPPAGLTAAECSHRQV